VLTYSLTVLLVLIALSVPVAAVLGVLSLMLAEKYMSTAIPAIGESFWQYGSDSILVAIPMFILLGEILLRAGITQRMYEALAQWLSWLPGGLMHSNIGSCAMFAATSGSSVATAATVSTVALPEVDRRGYNERLFVGTLAAGGTLGILIPPSINLIIYGLLTDTSVPQLYLAGLAPGIILSLLFMLTVIGGCLLEPSWGGTPITTTWRQRFAALPDLLPPTCIFMVVVGSIYAGVATPTEAASLGVIAALGLAWYYKTLNLVMLREAVEGTMTTTAMVMLIILAAVFLNFILAITGMTTLLTDFIKNLGLTPYSTLFVIILFYLVLGCFMETFSMLITTAPLIVPIVASLDLGIGDSHTVRVWFGILLTVLLETALITPPIGVNLYVVQGVRSRGSMNDVIIGTLPFVAAMFIMLALLVYFPKIALWLPKLFY
jgi:C4-dicarboxylate transporter, DctM subunit